MKEEILIITSKEQLLSFIDKIDTILNSFINQVYIKLQVTKELFEESISLILPKLNLLNKGIITSLNVIDQSFVEYEKDDFPLVKTLNKKSIIKFIVSNEMTIKINSFAIFLNEVKGTLILENENASIVCRNLNHAKIINLKSSTYITQENVYIKGDQIL